MKKSDSIIQKKKAEAERKKRIELAKKAAQKSSFNKRIDQDGVAHYLPTFKNVALHFETDENLLALFRYNIFSSRQEITRQPVWETQISQYPRAIEDNDIIKIRRYLADCYDVSYKKTDIEDAVGDAATKEMYNPVMNYLESLEWDGKERVSKWLNTYLGVESNEYTDFVGTMTLVGACMRIDKPGSKYDYMLILEGEQGLGKSTAINALGGEWTKEITLTERTKETVEKMQGAWIIEVAELSVFKKREIESLKAFITITNDGERFAYGRRSKDYPRRNIFIGTINPTPNGYLTDVTGNRRFLPVLCTKEVEIAALTRDRDQIWAEAYHLYKNNSPVYLSREIDKLAEVSRKTREMEDPWIQYIKDYCDDKDFVTMKDIWSDVFHSPKAQIDRVSMLRIGDCLFKIGWESRVKRFDGKTTRGFSPTKKCLEVRAHEHKQAQRLRDGLPTYELGETPPEESTSSETHFPWEE